MTNEAIQKLEDLSNMDLDPTCKACGGNTEVPPEDGGCECKLVQCPRCGEWGYPEEACACYSGGM